MFVVSQLKNKFDQWIRRMLTTESMNGGSTACFFLTIYCSIYVKALNIFNVLGIIALETVLRKLRVEGRGTSSLLSIVEGREGTTYDLRPTTEDKTTVFGISLLSCILMKKFGRSGEFPSVLTVVYRQRSRLTTLLIFRRSYVIKNEQHNSYVRNVLSTVHDTSWRG